MRVVTVEKASKDTLNLWQLFMDTFPSFLRLAMLCSNSAAKQRSSHYPQDDAAATQCLFVTCCPHMQTAMQSSPPILSTVAQSLRQQCVPECPPA
jgi:DNA polymerase III alpha subunit (gram-positive type)